MYKKYLFSRKHNGEEYKFYLYRQYFYFGEGHPKEIHDLIHVETPENAFGYPDTVYSHLLIHITPILSIDIYQNGY